MCPRFVCVAAQRTGCPFAGANFQRSVTYVNRPGEKLDALFPASQVTLLCRIIDDPSPEHILALWNRMKSNRQNFADRLGLDVRAVHEWEQERRVPGRAACGRLTVMDRDFEAVVPALGEAVTKGRMVQGPSCGCCIRPITI